MKTIGLQAILDMEPFDAGLKRYQAGVAAMSTGSTKAAAGAANLSAGLDKTGKSTGNLGNAFQQLTGISLSAAGGIAAAGAALKFCLDRAIESERAMAATEAVIKSTGGAAGLTAKQINDLAQSESQLTSIDDEVIQSGANMLLTFTQIGGDVFPRATRAMEDMAVAMAQGDTSAIDLKGTAIQLGKALQDPVAGATALKKVGVQLSDTQEQQIKDFMKVNDVASAQAVILAELEKEFGGMAEAMGNTGAGKIKKAQNAIDNLAASFGEKLLPVLGDAAETFNILLTAIDQVQNAEAEHRDAVAATSETYEAYVAEITRARYAALGMNTTTEKVVETIDKSKSSYENWAKSINGLTEAEWEATKANQNSAKAQVEATQATEDLAASQKYLGAAMYNPTEGIKLQARILEADADRMREAEQATEDLADAQAVFAAGLAGKVGQETKRFNETQYDLNQELDKTQAELDRLTAAQGQAYGPTAALAKQQGNLTKAQIDAQQATIALAKAQNALDTNTKPEKQESLNLSLQEAQLRLQEVNGKVGEYTDAINSNTGGIINNSTEIDKLKTKLGEQQAAIAANATEHAKASRQIIFDMLQEALIRDNLARGGKGLTNEQVLALQKLGLEWGLVEQASLDMAQAVIDSVESANGSVDTAISKVQAYQNSLNNLQSKVITITTRFIQEGGAPSYRGDMEEARNENTVDLGNPRSGMERARGGPVYANRPYWVGEEGPEPFIPAVDGRILSVPQASLALANYANQYSTSTTTNNQNYTSNASLNIGGVNLSQPMTPQAFKSMLVQALKGANAR